MAEPTNAPDAAENAAPPADVAVHEPGKGTAMKSAIQESLAKFKADGGFKGLEKEEEAPAPVEDPQPVEEVDEDEPLEEDASESQDDLSPAEAEETGDVAEGDDEPSSEASQAILIEGPGRRDGEKVTIEAPDEETAAVLRQWANNGMRRQEFVRQAEPLRAMKGEIEAFQRRLETDPSGLVLERAQPSTRRQIVRDILVNDPALMKEMADELYEMTSDPNVERRVRAEVERDAAKRQSRLAEVNSLAEENARIADGISKAVLALVPDSADDDAAEAFLTDAFDYLETMAYRQGPEKVNASTVEALLQSRLKLHGFLGTSPDSSTPTAPNRPSIRLKKAETDEEQAAKETGTKLAAEAKRKKAAITAPAGAGVKTASVALKPGQTVKERIADIRKRGLTFGFPSR